MGKQHQNKTKNIVRMKLAILSATLGAACAFTAPNAAPQVTSLRMSETTSDASSTPTDGAAAAPQEEVPAIKPINGWVPDKSLPCYGLPGATAPLGFFDPLGFTKDMDLDGVKRFREAEVLHGRVAMMAAVGYLIGESTPTITYGMNVHHTIANNQIPEVPAYVLLPFFLAINFTEAWRANVGWVEPGPDTLFKLRENYYPGDIKFDPMGLKPTNPSDFANMQTKELNNGRLAMLAAAGMCVQELVNGKGILENLGF